MTRWTLRSAAVAILAFSAATAVYAQAQTGNYSASDTGTIRRALAAKPANGAAYDTGEYPTFRLMLAPDDGSREVTTYCSVCHTPRYITMQPALPANAWGDEVNKMIKTFGATIPDDAVQKIIGYLQSHYTPETRKH